MDLVSTMQGRMKRRSWGCLLRSVASMGSVGTVTSLGSSQTVDLEESVPQQLYYPSPLAERSPGDPFQVKRLKSRTGLLSDRFLVGDVRRC